MLGGLFIYMGNTCVVRPQVAHWFVRGYLNDVTAMVVLLSFAALLTDFVAGVSLLRYPLLVAGIAACAALFWELVAPYYRDSVTDPWDFAAYACGGCMYMLVCRVGKKVARS